MVKAPLVVSALVALSFGLLAQASFGAEPIGPPANLDELKADKLKSLAKRDPRVTDLMPKVEAKLAKMKTDGTPADLWERLRKTVDEIAYTSSSVAEPRAKADVDLLDAISRDHAPLSKEELAPLQERYKKLCEQFDDLALNKDLDRAFHIHDKFIRYTSLGLWDKARIAEELERMEGLVGNAPDIAFGKSEMLNGYKNKRLGAVAKLVYIGSSPHEELYLTGDRRSVGLVEEATGGLLAMESGDHIIDDVDGKLVDITEANAAFRKVPFSPPTSLWLKGRSLDSKVPALTFRLSEKSKITMQDVIDGKLDDYFKKNLAVVGAPKLAVLAGFLDNFDQGPAENSFGADGKTPYYVFADPKLKGLDGDKLAEELKKRLDKGAFVQAKTLPAELSNQYGDPNIPDGPERVRDAWKKVRKIADSAAGETVAFYTCGGGFHGNKNAGKLGHPEAGNQAWNKLEYYWPGENVIDWLGVNAAGSDPATDQKGANLLESMEGFEAEVRSSSWQSTPVMLRGLAPSYTATPLEEAGWVQTVFQKIIPATYPNISIVFLGLPDHFTLWTREASSAFRTNVSSNKGYKYPLRFKILKSN